MLVLAKRPGPESHLASFDNRLKCRSHCSRDLIPIVAGKHAISQSRMSGAGQWLQFEAGVSMNEVWAGRLCGLLEDPGMSQINHFGQQLQIVATKRIRLLPFFAVFVEAADRHIKSNSGCRLVFPDRGSD